MNEITYGEGLQARLESEISYAERVFLIEPGTVTDPDMLIMKYKAGIEKHMILIGHMTGGTSQDVLQSLSRALAHRHISHAATGLASAWLHTRYAGFRISTVFLSEFPSEQEWNKIGIRWEERGGNVWLVQPNDE